MSSASRPSGMNSYNNRSSSSGAYISWKGGGQYANPQAVMSANIRPLTNKDYSNNVEYKYGIARPIQHYRKGLAMENADTQNPSYNNRLVRSSTRGASLVGAMQDRPGGVQTITMPGKEGTCITGCIGTGAITSWQPTRDITTKPSTTTTNPPLCCNAEKNARVRMRRGKGTMSKTYYPSHDYYLQARCKTYDQQVFNFLKDGESGALFVAQCSSGNGLYESDRIQFMTLILNYMLSNDWINQTQYVDLLYSPSSLPDFITDINYLNLSTDRQTEINIFVNKIISQLKMAHLFSPNSNPKCGQTYYKPSNRQFSVEGGVSSSSAILRKKVNTINKNYTAPTNDPAYTPKNVSAMCFV